MNRPVHLESHASDPAEVLALYREVCGWTLSHVRGFGFERDVANRADGSTRALPL